MTRLSLVVRGICLLLALTSVASAADGPEMNPYECLGRYEAATGNRTIPQVRGELEKKLHPLFEPGEPPTVKAMKACVVAMLKSRLGDSDASDYYAMAVENDPEEPGYEFWYGRYYSGFRGARGVVVENAEDHFYKALEKLNAKRKAGKFREYHAVVEEWTRKQLMVSYQEDGLHFLPWAKAYPQHSWAGRNVPSFAASAQFHISKDTRDFYRNNEMRLFTGELMFANSGARALGDVKAAQMYEIARAPLRYRHEERVRLRQNYLGAFDASFAYERMAKGQVLTYYLVPPAPYGKFVDVNLRELGFGYERVFPLYPLMDFKLKGGVKHIDRQGVVEFFEYRHEKFWMYEARPSFSHFVGPDKATLDLVYVYMDVSDVAYGVPADSLRSKYIRAANLEYAIYRPFVLPEVHGGQLGLQRSPTRGWYWNAGVADDHEFYGVRDVNRRDYYLGTRFEGAGNYDVSLQGTYSTSGMKFLDENTGVVGEDPLAPMSSKSFRTSAIFQRRLINPDAIPGINGSFLAPDMMNLVIPVSWDKGLSGSTCQMKGVTYDAKYTSADDCYKTYENVRVGAELWTKFFGTGFGGPAFLTTVGYDYQYFYNIKKAFHQVHLNLRMGWDWHKL